MVFWEALAAIGVLASVVGQGINVVLNLKLRAGLLESEQRTLAKVDETYQRKEVSEAMHCPLPGCPLHLSHVD